MPAMEVMLAMEDMEDTEDITSARGLLMLRLDTLEAMVDMEVMEDMGDTEDTGDSTVDKSCQIYYKNYIIQFSEMNKFSKFALIHCTHQEVLHVESG